MPTALLKEMNVEGLTRENVASFLQKYRKRMTREAEQRAQGSTHAAEHLGPTRQTKPSSRLRAYIPAVPSNLSSAGANSLRPSILGVVNDSLLANAALFIGLQPNKLHLNLALCQVFLKSPPPGLSISWRKPRTRKE